MNNDKEIIIQKYPYSGNSPNLIDYFSIIGYSENMISNLSNSNKNTDNKKPMILSSIISKNGYDLQNEEFIIDRIYPIMPKIIKDDFSIKNYNENIIFQSYTKVKDNNNVINKFYYSCYAYKFYEKMNNSEGKQIYVPKAFCIISQYPLFNTFKYICKNIIKNNIIQLPLELLIYSCVNYIPSPINEAFNLDLCSIKESSKIIPQLVGYPVIDFNLIAIFKTLSVNLVIFIYLMTFLEQDIIFISSSFEKLSVVIYVFHFLNFPFNNNSYHCNKSVHNNYYEKNSKIYYIVKNRKIKDRKPFIKVNLDDQRYYIDKIKEYENNYFLLNYIINMLEKNTRSENSIFLDKIILNIKKAINDVMKPVIDLINDDNNKFYFFENPNKLCKNIQEIFYHFCLNLFTFFYYDNIYSSESNKIQTNKDQNSILRISKILKKVNGNKLTKEETIFFKLFRKTKKYKTFIIKYMRNFDVKDIFKLNYRLFKEFIQIKINNNKYIFNNYIPYFKIIDNIFIKEDTKKNNNNIKNINFSELVTQYNNKRKKYEEYINKENKIMIMNKKFIYHIIYEFNNFENESLIKIFPYINYMKNNIISETNIEKIYIDIRKEMINSKVIPPFEMFLYSIINILLITMKLYSDTQLNEIFNLLKNILNEINYCKEYYLYVIIKVFKKYDTIYHPSKEVMNILFNNISIYIPKSNIIPNKEIINILSFYKNNMSNIILENPNKKDFKPKSKYIIYNKNCFTYKGNTSIKYLLEVCILNTYQSIYLNLCASNKKILLPKIIMKIENDKKKYETNFLSFPYLFIKSNLLFEQYLLDNLDIKKTNKDVLISLILNCIQYGKNILQIKETLIDYLINSVILLDKIEFNPNIINRKDSIFNMQNGNGNNIIINDYYKYKDKDNDKNKDKDNDNDKGKDNDNDNFFLFNDNDNLNINNENNKDLEIFINDNKNEIKEINVNDDLISIRSKEINYKKK